MLPVTLVFVTVILLVLNQKTLVPALPFLATVRNSGPRAASGGPNVHDFVLQATRITQAGGPRTSREARRFGRDPLRDHRATVGRDARTPWYIRVRALMLLIIVVVVVSLAIAGVTLLIIASGRFLLEILAG